MSAELEKELREMVITACKDAAKYWATVADDTVTVQDRCDGVAFTILSVLDGVGSLPMFTLTSHVHPDDEDQTWEGVELHSEMLHEQYYKQEE